MMISSQSSLPRSPSTSMRSYDSSSVSSVTSQAPSGYFHGLTPDKGLGSHHGSSLRLGPIVAHPQPQTSLHQPYTPVTATLTTSRDSYASRDSIVGTPGSQGVAPKRAYRKRRKDPSCDACRERKVKCDATEISSCSECSSRNVSCQFTKETNRRMSSIKQVQDLEKQIGKLTRENSSLRRLVTNRKTLSHGERGLGPIDLTIPAIGSEPVLQHLPNPGCATESIRHSMLTALKGVWLPLSQYRPPADLTIDHSRLDLPPRHVIDDLLRDYYYSVHTLYPLFHWPSLQQAVNNLDTSGSRLVASAAFVATVFGILSVGSLFSSRNPIERREMACKFQERSRHLQGSWSNRYDLENLKAAVLTTLFLNESNLKSAAWVSLGRVVRIAQDLGLHEECDGPSFLENEVNRRTWWTIYTMDRNLSLELDRPFLISDNDCSVPLPTAVDDHHIFPYDVSVPRGIEPLTQSFMAVIQVVRSYTAVKQALALPVIDSNRLSVFDSHLEACMRAFPAVCDRDCVDSLSPQMFNSVVHIFHTRIMLCRRNLTPACLPGVRLVALEQCEHIARDTAKLVARTTSNLASAATSLSATHIFRCTLFLLLLESWSPAVGCMRALALIDSNRDIVLPCGRYLTFFVRTLISKREEQASVVAVAQDKAPSPSSYRSIQPQQKVPHPLDQDQELLAYVSADLQATRKGGWIWDGNESEASTHHNRRQVRIPDHLITQPDDAFSQQARTGLSLAETREWGGWTRLYSLVETLASMPSGSTAISSKHPAPGQSTLPPLPYRQAEAWSKGSPRASAGSLGATMGILPPLAQSQLMTASPGARGFEAWSQPRSMGDDAKASREECHDGETEAGDAKTERSRERISIANII